MTIQAPTQEDFLDEIGLKSISREAIDKWRWGTVEREIFVRESDNTIWSVTYRISADGETNELREGEAHIVQVEPYEKTITDYRPVAA